MLLPILFAMISTPAPELRISFTNLATPRGKLYVGIYNTANAFMQPDKAVWKAIVPVEKMGSLDLTTADLPPGVYAVSCFHDVNGNGKLDTNLLGIPTEPYGFSNNVRPTLRAPRWEEARFELPPAGRSLSIRLEKW